MTVTITHNFVSPVSDELEADKVGPDEWNADHVIAGDLAGLNTASGNISFYVATTGSDSNTGLTVGSPFLTIQKALLAAASYDYQGLYAPTINIAAGTYTITASLLLPELVNLSTSGNGNIAGAGATTIIYDVNSSIAMTASGVNSRWRITNLCVDSPRVCFYSDHDALIGLGGTITLEDRSDSGVEFLNCFHGGRINLSTATLNVATNAFAAFFLGGGGGSELTAILTTINLPSGTYGTPSTDYFINTSANGLNNITFLLCTINNFSSFVGSQAAIAGSGGTVLTTDNGLLSDLPGVSTGNTIDNVNWIIGGDYLNSFLATFAGAPTATQIPSGTWGVYHNTNTGAVVVAANVGGVIKTVALT